MTLKITKIRVCDICRAEWDEFTQELTERCVEARPPTESQNALTYHGYTYDLCMMCMAPVHHAFKEQVRKIHAEQGLSIPEEVSATPSKMATVTRMLLDSKYLSSVPGGIKRVLP